ncbi:MAG: glycosyltransferase [Chthoniobacteraceae bacterium]
MKFSVITASHNQPAWLKRCVRSVADQAPGVGVEHIIQEKGPAPDTVEWLHANSNAKIFVEDDTGMYDALNRGLRRVSGDIFAILNCDEQYLPGALARVEQAFRENPDADIVAGDYLITNAAGELLSFRRATPLRASMILTDHLYDFTCALFFRRRLIERGIFFDPAYRAAGDADWVSRLLLSGARVAYVHEYLATFAITGGNLSQRADQAEEIARLRKITPRWAVAAAPLLRKIRHMEKLFLGGYRSAPIAYEIYVGEDELQRTRFVCEKPSFRHPWA